MLKTNLPFYAVFIGITAFLAFVVFSGPKDINAQPAISPASGNTKDIRAAADSSGNLLDASGISDRISSSPEWTSPQLNQNANQSFGGTMNASTAAGSEWDSFFLDNSGFSSQTISTTHDVTAENSEAVSDGSAPAGQFFSGYNSGGSSGSTVSSGSDSDSSSSGSPSSSGGSSGSAGSSGGGGSGSAGTGGSGSSGGSSDSSGSSDSGSSGGADSSDAGSSGSGSSGTGSSGSGSSGTGSSGSGATYYLDAGIGSSGDGTSWEAAKKTWAEMDTLLDASEDDGAGDTVKVKAGSYGVIAGGVIAKARTDWLTIIAHTGDKPDITSIVITPASAVNAYVSFDGFHIANGISLGDTAKPTNYVKILNCDVESAPNAISGYYEPYYNQGGHIIHTVASPTNITIQGCDIHNGFRGVSGGGSDWLIKNNTIHCTAEDGMSLSYIADNTLIEGNTFYDNRRFKTSMKATGTITGYFTAGDAVAMNGTAAKGTVGSVGANYIYIYCQTETNFYGQTPYSTKTITGPNGTLTAIADIDPPHCDSFQMDTATVVTGLVIRGNLFDRRRAVGIGTEDGQTVKLKNSNVTLMEVTFENNILDGSITGDGQGFDIKFNNNTVKGAWENRSKTNNSVYTEMFNNIIYQLNLTDDTGNSTISFIAHGNNIFKSVPNKIFGFSLDGTEIESRSDVSFAALFTDSVSSPGDFTLPIGSTARNFGNARYGPTTDIRGKSRDSHPDAGCYEYGSFDSSMMMEMVE